MRSPARNPAPPTNGGGDDLPLSIWLLSARQGVFGDSPAALRGLPGAISGHNSYWLWGPGDADGSVVVIAGGAIEGWAPHWGAIERRAVWDCGYCLPGRNHASVYVAREPRAALPEMWAALRHYR